MPLKNHPEQSDNDALSSEAADAFFGSPEVVDGVLKEFTEKLEPPIKKLPDVAAVQALMAARKRIPKQKPDHKKRKVFVPPNQQKRRK